MTALRQRIVVAIDLTEYAEIVLEHALDLASRYGAPDLHFVTVAEHPNVDVDVLKTTLAALVLPALDSIDRSDWRVRLHVRTGDGPAEITDLAAEIRAHLIVIGRFGTHRPHRKIGASAAKVVDLAPCPTLVVGLSDQAPDAIRQCPDCVAARAESDGERWFCTAHTSDEPRLSSISVPSTWTGGTLMW